MALPVLRLFMLQVCIKFQVGRPFHSEDMTHFLCHQPLVGLTLVRRTTWRHRDLHLWRWWSWRLSAIRVFVLRLCTKFEVRRPFRSEDTIMTHFLSPTSTLTFDLETGARYVNILPVMWATLLPILVFLGRFVLHISGKPARRITWPCDLRGHNACLCRGSSSSVCVPR